MNARFLLAAALLALPAAASAHRLWFLPSSTVLAGGEDQWVTVDAAVSNELFFFDHQPMRLQGVKAWAPDGQEAALENAATGRYRSTFDVHLVKPGTWKIGTVMSGVMGGYKLNGAEQRLPRGTRADQLATAIPAGATEVKITQVDNRNETFVTVGAPTTTALKPTGQGLELVPITHPNELVSGETTRFGFVVDGKPASGLTVTVIPGGIRYRGSPEEMTFKTDAKGEVAIAWKAPGMYWLNVSAEGAKPTLQQAQARRMGYTATLEVLQP
jgi:uncharacterized GH25 family protein